MPSNFDRSDRLEQLRQQAIELLQRRPAPAADSPPAILELIHELGIHQAELEIQNEELRRAEQGLAENRREFLELYEFAPCAYVTLGAGGRITRANLAAAGLLGTERGRLMRSTLSAFVTPAGEDFLHSALKKAGRDGTKQTVELPLRGEGASPIWVRADIEADRDEAGAVTRWRVALLDISGRKHAEEQREIIPRLLSLFNLPNESHEVIKLITGLVRDWLDCDAVGIRLREGEDFPYFEIGGFPEQFAQMENRLCAADQEVELLWDSDGNPVLECMCGTVLRGRTDATKDFFTGFGSFWTSSTSALLASTSAADRQGRTRNRCHDAGYESVALIPLRAGGETFGLLQCNDRRKGRFTPELIASLEQAVSPIAVGLRQRMEHQALGESEERYRRLFNAVGDAVMVFDAESRRFLDVNEAATLLYGYTYEEFLLLRFTDITTEPEATDVSLRQTMRGGSVRIDGRFHRKKDGTVFPVAITGSTTEMLGRQAYCGVVRDISERRRASDKLRESQEQLIQAEKLASLGTLTSSVAHEINNPNNFIMLNLPVLEQVLRAAEPLLEQRFLSEGDFDIGKMPFSKVRERIPKIVHGIREGALRIKQYVEELRGFARLEASGHREAVDLREVVGSAARLIENQIHESTDRFTIDQPATLPQFNGHPQRLSQVVINLIQNACHALTDRSQAITVTLCHQPERDEMVLTVRDEGCGMDGETLGRIFDPFFTTRQKKSGTGLGLTVSKRIVDEHGGRLEFESEPGKGTTARMVVPAGNEDRYASPVEGHRRA
jgi:PAS domain S-box-containing protein